MPHLRVEVACYALLLAAVQVSHILLVSARPVSRILSVLDNCRWYKVKASSAGNLALTRHNRLSLDSLVARCRVLKAPGLYRSRKGPFQSARTSSDVEIRVQCAI